MSDQICAVHHTVTALAEMISTGQLKTPRNRRTAEEIQTLLEDIAWGNAGAEHLPISSNRRSLRAARFSPVTSILTTARRVTASNWHRRPVR